jgi:hypothetical protein
MEQYINQLQSNFYALGKSLKLIPEHILETAQINNQWFTKDNIIKACDNWYLALEKENIVNWLKPSKPSNNPKKIGIIMAGNIPFVGLHDLLCVLSSGHKAVVKLSSNDEILMGYAILLLKQFQPELDDKIIISDSMKGIDALIATGSNNSSRYFESYFKDIPKIIRKNRTSIAVLNNTETNEELTSLADDIYSYFGLGCRNVTHLLLPRNIELKKLYVAYDKYIDIVNHHKYYNNYMYHKSILLMNLSKHYDNGFMLFQEKEGLQAPIATLNYHFYDSDSEVLNYIEQNKNDIQCIVSKWDIIENKIPYGKSQSPSLSDYADNVDTMKFLENI